MARVMICSACGQVNPVSEMFCRSCGASLANVDPVEEDLKKGEPPAPTPSAVETAGRPADHPASATRREERLPRLCFEWGDVEIPRSLAIGRDPTFSPLADRLQAYATVSGRHAQVRAEGDGITVTHLGHTNPTYVDGRALQEGESVLARDGATIGFSRALLATLRFG